MDESEKELVDEEENEKQSTVVVKAANLSSKVRRRMYGRITRKLHNVQLRTKETVERLSFTVDLVISHSMSSMLD